MKRGSVVVLALITVIAVIAAAVALSRYEQRTSLRFEPQPMYPQVIAQAQRITEIAIADASRSVRLWRDTDGWRVAQRHDYPADEQKIANLVAEVARIRLIEPRSDKPQLQERMNLRDLSQADSRAKQVRLLAGEQTLADLLIGETRRAAGSGPRQFYARRSDEARAWLAEGSLDPSTAPTAWLAGTIVDINQERIRRVTIEHPDGDHSVLQRATSGEAFALLDAPPDQVLQHSRLNAVSYGVQGLPLNDVMRPQEAPIAFDAPVVVTFDTFDGLSVVVEVASHQRSSYYARLRAGHTPSDAAAGDRDPAGEAARINDFVSRWVYLIPPHTADTFTRRREEFFETDKTAQDGPATP